MPEEETANCPVCDSEIPKDSKTCPNCGVDLSLFDLEEDVDIDQENMGDLSGLIEEGEGEEELIEKIKGLGGDMDEEGEDKEEIEEVVEEEGEEEDVEEIVTFECPICGAEVDEDAIECPNCGAEFVEEEEEEGVEEEEAEEGVIEEEPEGEADMEERLADGIDRVRALLREAQETRVDITEYKDSLKELIDLTQEEDYSRGLEVVDELEAHGSDILELDEVLDDIRDMEEGMEGGSESVQISNRIDEIIERANGGEYTEALEDAEELKEELEEEREEIEEEKKKEEEDMREKLEDRIQSARKSLSEARDTKIKIDELKSLMGETVQAKKSGELEEALEKADEIEERSERVIDVSEKLSKGKSKVKEMKDMGLDYEPYLSDLKEGKSRADAGEYSSAMDLFDKTISEVEEKLVEERELREKREKYEEKFEEKKEDAEELLDPLEKEEIDITHLREYMNLAVEAKERDQYEDGIEELEEVIESAEELQTIVDEFSDARDRIQDLEDSEVDTEEYEDRLDEVNENIGVEDYDQALDILDTLLSDLKEKLDEKKIEMELKEEMAEDGMEEAEEEAEAETEVKEEMEGEIEEEEAEQEMEEELEVEEAIEEGVPEAEEEEISEEEETSVEDVEDKVSEIKSLLQTAKKHGIEVEEGRDIITNAVKSAEEKDFSKTLEALEEGEVRVLNSLKEKTEDEIFSLESEIEEVEDEDIRESAEEYLNEAREYWEEEEYEMALETLPNVERELRKLEGPQVEIENKIDEVENIMFQADLFDMDISDEDELLSKATTELEKENWEEAETLAERAKENILERVPDMFSEQAKEAKKKLKKAKIAGADVSKAVNYLKQARFAKDRGDMVKTLDYLKKYKDEIEKKWSDEWG